MAVNKRKIRIPFQPLNYSAKHLAQPQELMINYSNGAVYVMGLDGNTEIEFLTGQSVSDYAQNEINKILDGVSEQYNTLEKIDIILKELEDWKTELSLDNDSAFVDSLVEILKKFQGMSEGDQNIIQSINSKVDKVPGKVLSDKDFNNELKSKLEGIADNANKYIHPKEKVCNFQPELLSVNGKTGNVVLSHKDIEGLEDIDPDANNYVHPTTQVCSYVPKVNRVNNKIGDVILTKEDIGLNNIQNYPMAFGSQYDNFVTFENNKYTGYFMAYRMIYNEIAKNYPASVFSNTIDLADQFDVDNFNMSSADFLTAVGLTGKSFRNTATGFHTVMYNGKEMYISPSPVINISWDDLNSAGLIAGKTITYKGKNYKCRTIKATEGQTLTAIPYYSGYFYPIGEAERFFFARNYTTLETDIPTDIVATEEASATECYIISPFRTNINYDQYFTTVRPEGISKIAKSAKLSWYPIIEKL